MTKKRNKIAVHLNDETHQAIKTWSEYQGTTMPKLAEALLEQMHPVLIQMIETYEAILEGQNKDEALRKMLAKGLELANEKLNEVNEDEDERERSDRQE
ncbi:hypothetical protein [Psychrobacter sanguinis]|uniref:hypothetical protein n=1 Tax=Psychrobacter sanguinis TaxID=861445 RepID=UPI00191AC41E|nr:hypothetical protein [Psychrobacter sanguinis]